MDKGQDFTSASVGSESRVQPNETCATIPEIEKCLRRAVDLVWNGDGEQTVESVRVTLMNEFSPDVVRATLEHIKGSQNENVSAKSSR